MDRLESLEREYDAVVIQLSDPAVISDQRRLREVSRRHKELEPVIAAYKEYKAATADLATAWEMLEEADAGDREILRQEIDEFEARQAELEERLKVLLLPKDPNDGKNVIVEIRGAEGGEEANLFARDLYEMYVRYADRKGFGVETLSADPSDMGGFNQVTFLVKGDAAWSHLKAEGGPHRVQRVPVTESQGRVHTSSATVTVLPEAEEVEVQIDDKDLKIDVYRSTGPGGQSVNTTDSAVRITHLPTGHRGRHAGREEPDPEPGQSHAGSPGPPAEGRAGPPVRRALERPPEPGGRGRPVREDPDLQLQGEPGHRPPNRPDSLQAGQDHAGGARRPHRRPDGR